LNRRIRGSRLRGVGCHPSPRAGQVQRTYRLPTPPRQTRTYVLVLRLTVAGAVDVSKQTGSDSRRQHVPSAADAHEAR
jgi:hypothetical protein